MSTVETFRKFELRAPSAQTAVDVFEEKWASDFADACPGVAAGDAPHFTADQRPRLLAEAFGDGGRLDGMSVLELGPLEGGHTYQLETLGARRILAIEANVEAFLKCLVVKEITGLRVAQFVLGDFNEYLQATSEKFDVVMCSGVLYHMEDPISLIRAIGGVTDRCFVWTHYYDEAHYPGPVRRSYRDPRYPDTDLFALAYADMDNGRFWGGNRPTSAWLRRDDIIAAFRDAGFRSIQVLSDDLGHPGGACFTFWAAKDEPSCHRNDAGAASRLSPSMGAQRELARSRQRAHAAETRALEQARRAEAAETRMSAEIARAEAAERRADDQAARAGAAKSQLRETLLRLEAIESSTTWRASAPLRTWFGNHPRLARFVRRSVKLLWWSLTFRLPRKLRERRQIRRASADETKQLR